MKKIFSLVLLAMFAMGTYAQIVSSRSTGVTKQEAPADGWSMFYLQWNPSSFVPDQGSSESFTGLSMGWNKAVSLTPSNPLFLEFGIGLQYSFKKLDKYMGWDVDINYSMFSLKAPVQVDYAYNIPNSTIALIPNAGLDFRFNVGGKMKSDDVSINLFDKDDMGGSDNTWNRFQVGWHIGLNASFNKKLLLGLSYGSDFSEIATKTKISTTSLTVGFFF